MKRCVNDLELEDEETCKHPRITQPIYFEALPNELLSHLLCFCERHETYELFQLDDFRYFKEDATFWKRKVTKIPPNIKFENSPLPPHKRYEELEALYGRFDPDTAKEYLHPVAYNQRVGYHYQDRRMDLYIPLSNGIATYMERASVGFFGRMESIHAFGCLIRWIVDKDITKVVMSKYTLKRRCCNPFIQKISILYGSSAIFYYVLDRYRVISSESKKGVVAAAVLHSSSDIIPGILRVYREHNLQINTAFDLINKGMARKDAVIQVFEMHDDCTRCEIPRVKCDHYSLPIVFTQPAGNDTHFYSTYSWV